MKLTVTKNLNVRVGKPSLNAPCYQYIAPGSILEVDGKLYEGDKFESITAWYRDEADNYYWSGGVTVMETKTAMVNYSDFVKGLGFSWLKSKGRNVTTAVIDTGIILNPSYFNSLLAKETNLADNNTELYHGNFIAGIIAGTGSVNGLANEASLLSIKYKSNTFSNIPKQLLNLAIALESITQLASPVVVNISQGFRNDQLNAPAGIKDRIIQGIQNICLQKNKFVICAAGDNNLMNDSMFPASAEGCITVGAIEKLTLDTGISFTRPVNVLCPMCDYASYNNSFSIIKNTGSSFSTAMVTALIAGLLSDDPAKIFSRNEILAELNKASVKKESFTYGDLRDFQYEITIH